MTNSPPLKSRRVATAGWPPARKDPLAVQVLVQAVVVVRPILQDEAAWAASGRPHGIAPGTRRAWRKPLRIAEQLVPAVGDGRQARIQRLAQRAAAAAAGRETYSPARSRGAPSTTAAVAIRAYPLQGRALRGSSKRAAALPRASSARAMASIVAVRSGAMAQVCGIIGRARRRQRALAFDAPAIAG